VNITKMAPISDGTTPMLSQFETNVAAGGQTQNYTVAISVRKVHDDGTFDPWQTTSAQRTVNASSAPVLNSTGSAHLLIGMGYDDSGTARPLGNSGAGGATPTTGTFAISICSTVPSIRTGSKRSPAASSISPPHHPTTCSSPDRRLLAGAIRSERRGPKRL